MRISNPSEIVNPNSEENTPLLSGGDDFLSRINQTITNFKELLKMAQEAKGLSQESPTKNLGNNPGGNPPAPAPIAQFVQTLIASGYGDSPVGELFDKIKPYSIKQLLELMKHAKPK